MKAAVFYEPENIQLEDLPQALTRTTTSSSPADGSGRSSSWMFSGS